MHTMKAKNTKKPISKKKAVKSASAKAPKLSGPLREAKVKDDPESVDMHSILTEVQGVANKKHLEHWEPIECPYCGEGIEVHIDSAEDGQTMYQDCNVCCKPISLHVEVEDEDVHISVGRA